MGLPAGYRFSGIACGIKASGKRDYSLVVSDYDAVAVGVYTQNLVFAAPVEYDRQVTPTDRCRAVVTNSGNANACTGQRGLADTRTMAETLAAQLGCESGQVLVMSTGIIGEFLPMDRIREAPANAVRRLSETNEAFAESAEAITTTDQGIKIAHRSLELGGKTVQISGMAKGAGMIGPNMATMLCTICTDAALEQTVAYELLKAAVDVSFNCISVEGHTSTNDTVLLLANGQAGADVQSASDRAAFLEQLKSLCIELARMIPNDGEGADHLITIEVRGAASDEDARQLAKTVGQSALVRAGIAGNDPNWGRIVSACGYAGVAFNPSQLALKLNGTVIYQAGAPVDFDAANESQKMKDNREVSIELQFEEGDGSARFWTSDLTVDYVRFNSEYTT